MEYNVVNRKAVFHTVHEVEQSDAYKTLKNLPFLVLFLLVQLKLAAFCVCNRVIN